jgi:hypothetical protein
MDAIRVVDSATQLDAASRGTAVVCGSHGGLYAAWLAAMAGVRAIVLNDAGLGRSSAGVAGIAWLGSLGIPACAIDYRSARIADGADMMANGVVSTVNEAAAALGCAPGQTCGRASGILLKSAIRPHSQVPEIGETRLRIANTGHREVWAIDSITLARESDSRCIMVTGSHGALVGGKPDSMLEVDVFAAFFNDAGGGKDEAGFARLWVLEDRGIAAATVSHNTARIGDGRSTYDTGVISRLNEPARRLEMREGMSARDAVIRMVGLG